MLDYSSTMGRPNDTSREARQRQVDAYRAMTPEERLQLADQMSVDVRSLARSGIRARQPDDASDEDAEAALARMFLGPELAAVVRARRVPNRR